MFPPYSKHMLLFPLFLSVSCSYFHSKLLSSHSLFIPDIEFKMPFHNSGEQEDKNGKEEVDDEEEADEKKEDEEVEEDDDEEEEGKGGATSWLADLGVETSQFPNLNPNRAKV